jgi:hypothetical protein
MFERAAIFSALVILVGFILASLSYYHHLESRKQVQIVQEQPN